MAKRTPKESYEALSPTIHYLRGMGVRHTNDMIRMLQERGFTEKDVFAAVNWASKKGYLRHG